MISCFGYSILRGLFKASVIGKLVHTSAYCIQKDDTPLPHATMSSLKHFAWLSQHLPAFRISGNSVKVIQKPHDFYHALKVSESPTQITQLLLHTQGQ